MNHALLSEAPTHYSKEFMSLAINHAVLGKTVTQIIYLKSIFLQNQLFMLFNPA